MSVRDANISYTTTEMLHLKRSASCAALPLAPPFRRAASSEPPAEASGFTPAAVMAENIDSALRASLAAAAARSAAL